MFFEEDGTRFYIAGMSLVEILDLNDGSYWLLRSVIEVAIFIRNINPDASRTIEDRLRSIV